MSLLIDQSSCECLVSELDIFGVPPTQTSIERQNYKVFFPVNAVTGNAPLEFQFTSPEDEYLDFSQSFIRLICRITKYDGTLIDAPQQGQNPADEAYVLPINYPIATQFKSVEVFLNGTQISSNDNMYAYGAYIETLLTYSKEVKAGFLQSGLFHMDTNTMDMRADNLNRANCDNSGARRRWLATRYSQAFELIGKIHTPIFNQEKLMLPKMDIRIRFNRHDPKFSLMAKDDTESYGLFIDKAELYILHKKITESVRLSHEAGLLSKKAKYPIKHREMKFFTKPAGTADLSEHNMVQGILPNFIVVGLVPSDGFNGSLSRNPIQFDNYDLDSISVRKNGQAIPFPEIEMVYDDHDGNGKIGAMGYLSLLGSTGRLYHDKGFMALTEYTSTCSSLYGFDLSQDGHGSGGRHFSLLQEGTLSLLIKLKAGLRDSVTIVVYMERDGLIEIDQDRNVVIE